MRPLLDSILEFQTDEVIWDRVYDVVTDSANNAVTESMPRGCHTPLCDQTPMSINTGSFLNTTGHRKYVDGVLKEKLGGMYVDVDGFFETLVEVMPGLKQAAKMVLDKCKE